MLELLTDPEAYVSLLVLSIMEIVLGIDNIVFITILCSRLPRERQLKARRLGLFVALFSRLGLLSTISWMMHLQDELFAVAGHPVTWKDMILIVGGTFLLWKATKEIFENVEHPGESKLAVEAGAEKGKASGFGAFLSIIVQIMVLDIVFSIDSVITAVGMAQQIPIMIAAMVIAVGVMMAFAGPVGDFIEKHPSVRVLALAFLVLIGVMLIAEGTGQHVSKGYIYSAMGFSLFVQILNLRIDARARAKKDDT